MKATKASDIKRDWHFIDIKGKVLGRTAVEIARLLMGKQKPYYIAHLDCGDYVVVTNAKEVLVTGKKETQKKFYRHSGYPGGLRVETFDKLRIRKPQELISHAVRGMLPQNKLRDRRLRRLFVFTEEEHPYQDKLRV